MELVPPLAIGYQVSIKTDKLKLWKEKGNSISVDYISRSYAAETGRGTYRRNRRHICNYIFKCSS